MLCYIYYHLKISKSRCTRGKIIFPEVKRPYILRIPSSKSLYLSFQYDCHWSNLNPHYFVLGQFQSHPNCSWLLSIQTCIVISNNFQWWPTDHGTGFQRVFQGACWVPQQCLERLWPEGAGCQVLPLFQVGQLCFDQFYYIWVKYKASILLLRIFWSWRKVCLLAWYANPSSTCLHTGIPATPLFSLYWLTVNCSLIIPLIAFPGAFVHTMTSLPGFSSLCLLENYIIYSFNNKLLSIFYVRDFLGVGDSC